MKKRSAPNVIIKKANGQNDMYRKMSELYIKSVKRHLDESNLTAKQKKEVIDGIIRNMQNN